MRRYQWYGLFAALVIGSVLTAGPLMRFPDIHGDTVVFVSGEDIWSVDAAGGIARRLTIHDGEERYPRFSPDGQWIAFTGEYDGNSDVYVMNRHGGHITRVTYHPASDQVVGWHPVNGKILFSSYRTGFGYTRLYLINPDGTGLEPLIMHESVQGSFSPDGGRIAYNKVSRENRTWKRYQGGTAQEIYIYDFGKNTDVNITRFPGTDRIPIWMDKTIVFSSDRDGLLNLYAYHTEDGRLEQLTRHQGYDVRRPSGSSGKVVYELGGEIWILDIHSGETRAIPIEVHPDAPEARPYWKDVSRQIQGVGISPTGQRALIVARGEVFSVPREKGMARNLSLHDGARDKDAVWSPDGRTVAWISDRTGEYEIYIQDAAARNEPVRLTKHSSGYRHTLKWSPDSRMLAYTDHSLRLYILDVNSQKITEVDKARHENIDVSLDVKPIYDFCWSPDSRYVAYSKMDDDWVNKIYIYSLSDGRARCVSSGLFNDFHPVFSEDGLHLFFVSNRHFDPVLCDFEWQMVYKNAAGIYALSLTKASGSVLPLRSDEETPLEEEAIPSGVIIDFEGIEQRVEALPLPASNYRNLSVSGNDLFYLDKEQGDFNRFEYRSVGPRDLYAYDFDSRKARTVIRNIDDYKLSFDGSRLVYRRGNEVGIIDAKAADSNGNALNLSGLKMWIDPVREWKQIFVDAWRFERDYYYEPGMHGLDWDAVRARYEPLIDRAACRQDVQFVIGELIGELNTSHTYVYGGDVRRRSERVGTGMLGVDWEADTRANRYRFSKIYRVHDWSGGTHPSLDKPGIEVSEGEYLLAVNGREVTADRNIYSYFQNLDNVQVQLLVNSRPEMKGAREITVQTAGSENMLRYQAWMEHNRMICEKESGGRIGYIHLPDTYLRSAQEFPKYWYSQTRKQGLIIDGRFNGGGLDPVIFLSRLNSPILTYWTRRYSHDQIGPHYATRAHMVCLTNRQAGSGGDMLPWEFQRLGMGPVIGTRTWGGLVGVSNFIGLIDGGGLTAPDYRIYSPEGEWVVENEGVTPDIIVEQHPAEMDRGYDSQLMEGIRQLLKKIEEEPRTWPVHPEFPKHRVPARER